MIHNSSPTYILGHPFLEVVNVLIDLQSKKLLLQLDQDEKLLKCNLMMINESKDSKISQEGNYPNLQVVATSLKLFWAK